MKRKGYHREVGSKGSVEQTCEPMDPTFSQHSYGFRPERSAHQAVAQAQQYIVAGYGWVVDLDLEKFLDDDSYYTPCFEV